MSHQKKVSEKTPQSVESIFVPHNDDEDESLAQDLVPEIDLSKNVSEKTNTKTDTKKLDTKYARRKSETLTMC